MTKFFALLRLQLLSRYADMKPRNLKTALKEKKGRTIGMFIGILVGGFLYSGFNFTGAIEHVFVDGMVGALSDGWNVGILIFLVILGKSQADACPQQAQAEKSA